MRRQQGRDPNQSPSIDAKAGEGDLAIEARDWNVGLLVGPSGSGKSSILAKVFGDMPRLKWTAGGVIDDFAAKYKMDEIAKVCSAVGFNTIPSWMKPYAVLSNGERFRVDLARRLVELTDPILVDEFTSVVDRQVAKIGPHAVQKFVRRNKRQFVAATCHYDVIEWLQPDWILETLDSCFTMQKGDDDFIGPTVMPRFTTSKSPSQIPLPVRRSARQRRPAA